MGAGLYGDWNSDFHIRTELLERLHFQQTEWVGKRRKKESSLNRKKYPLGIQSSPHGSVGKESTCNIGDMGEKHQISKKCLIIISIRMLARNKNTQKIKKKENK